MGKAPALSLVRYGKNIYSPTVDKQGKHRETQLKRKEIHRTWTWPDGRTINQTEHVLIERRHTNIIATMS